MSSFAFDPEETTQWEQSHPRTIAPEKWKKFEGYAAEIFEAFGMDHPDPLRARALRRHQRIRRRP